MVMSICKELAWAFIQFVTLLLSVATIMGYRGIFRVVYFLGWIMAAIFMVKIGMWSSNMTLGMTIGFIAVTSIPGFIFGFVALKNHQATDRTNTPTVKHSNQNRTTGPITPKGWESE